MSDEGKMLRRVAKAICASYGHDPEGLLIDGGRAWRRNIPEAKAAITAMRKPTQRMIDAGFQGSSARLSDEGIEEAYRDMIDAALK